MSQNEYFLQALVEKLEARHSLEGIRHKLAHEKLKWYHAQLVATAVESIIIEDEVQSSNLESRIPTVSSKTKPEYKVIIGTLKERYVSAQANKIQQAHERNPLLGINNGSDSSPMPEHAAKSVRRMVNEHLQQKLIAVSNFYQPSIATAGDNLLLAKASQLPLLVENDLKLVKENKLKMKELSEKNYVLTEKLLSAYTEALKSCEILLQTKLEKLPPVETQNAEYLAQKSGAMLAKLELIESQVMLDTYSKPMIEQLLKMRKNLDKKLRETRGELEEAERSYRTCLSAGPEFQKIAKEYAAVRKDIEARSWALEELKAAKSHI